MKTFSRNLRRSRAVGIPKAIYNRLGLSPGMEMRISTEGNKIIIEPIGFVCQCCGRADKKHTSTLFGICTDCDNEIQYKVKTGMSLDCAFKVVQQAAHRE